MAVRAAADKRHDPHHSVSGQRVSRGRARRSASIGLLVVSLLVMVVGVAPRAASAQSGSSGTELFLSALLKSATPAPVKPPPTPTPGPTPAGIRIAIIGDSTQDEYQAPENARPAWNWVEVLAHTRALPLGDWGAWGGARRTGYEFDWARSGATTGDALSSQVPGVVAQLRDGEVTHVLMQIGTNDFVANNLALQIYAGVPVGRAPLDAISDNIISAARQIAAAAPGKLIVAAVQDYQYLDLVPEPGYSAAPDVEGHLRVQEALTYLNGRVRVALEADGIAWWDFNAALKSELTTRRQGDLVIIDGLSVNVRQRGSAPTNGFIDDIYMHPGTALSGLFAKVYIDEMNAQWQFGLAPLTDPEIRAAAQQGP